MNRRNFFSALLSAPAAIPSVARERPLEILEIQGGATGICVCGSAMFAHGRMFDGTLYFTCVNQDCPQFNVPVVLPRLAVERADPKVVRAVQREEKAQEEREEKAHNGIHQPWRFRNGGLYPR